MNYGKMLKSLIWKRYTDEFYIKPGKRAGNLSAYNQWLNDDSDLEFASWRQENYILLHQRV